MVSLMQECDYVAQDISFAHMYGYLGTNLLSTNATISASLFCGQSLMTMYWAYSSKQMQNIASNQTANELPAIRKGILFFYPNRAQKSSGNIHG
ncbi:hypothetical protein EJ03DRAFT_368865 [Teratosphaeria nubilosa]|uniref:Uncharacterized protein n=1 Tax=Teratosphaeria nubilosa TaxID=161662 RepID=A0A6G1KZ27_9PEZI|nr:hypothetical protein EJ03DRAFT_368865 [Teratosphaeria nubilosa]